MLNFTIMQEFILAILFTGALAYVGRHIYRQYQAKTTGCSKGCGCTKDEKSILIVKPK